MGLATIAAQIDTQTITGGLSPARRDDVVG